MVGIELNAEAAREAGRFYDRVIVADIESLEELDYPRGHFDAIILGDILEHLRDPASTLERLSRYLDDRGFVVCTLPNVAHFYNRLMLLMGRWDYEDYGILDRTHMRHFTVATAKQLVQDAGFRITLVDYTAWFPMFYLKRFRIGKAARYHLTRLRPSLLAFQIVLKGEKDLAKRPGPGGEGP
jgi:SAM-dependent methyltransferase